MPTSMNPFLLPFTNLVEFDTSQSMLDSLHMHHGEYQSSSLRCMDPPQSRELDANNGSV